MDAQRRIVTGVVQDVNSQPQVGVTVGVSGSKSVVTDDSGRFRIELPHRDRVTFDLRRVGLMPSRLGLNVGGDTGVVVTVLAAPASLERVDVTAKTAASGIAEFEQRFRERTRGTNSGYFVTAADIEQRRPSRLSHLLGGFPSIDCKRPNTDGRCLLVSTKMVVDDRGKNWEPCPITLYLDGTRLNPLTSAKRDDRFVELDGLIGPESVAGLEYYPSGNRAPSKYQPLRGTCGVLLLWSRRSGSTEQ